MKSKEDFKKMTEQVIKDNGVLFLSSVIENIEDKNLKHTFNVFISEADKGDKEAESLLVDHIAGYLENEQSKVMY